VDLEITPQPTEDERAAIAKALAQEPEGDRVSAWAQQVLPKREPEEA
jgi:hypothetical protein